MLHITQERCTKAVECCYRNICPCLPCPQKRSAAQPLGLVWHSTHGIWIFYRHRLSELTVVNIANRRPKCHAWQAMLKCSKRGGGKNKDHPHCLTSEENAIKNKMCGCLFLILFNIKIANSLKLINLRSPERHWTMLQRQATQKQALIRECNKVNTSIRLILLVLGNYKWLIWLVSD